jgi:hypothetical protein
VSADNLLPVKWRQETEEMTAPLERMFQSFIVDPSESQSPELVAGSFVEVLRQQGWDISPARERALREAAGKGTGAKERSVIGLLTALEVCEPCLNGTDHGCFLRA